VVLGAGNNNTSTSNTTLIAAVPSAHSGDWHFMNIPLASFSCTSGSTGSLENVDRIDFQNINVRDADICLDDISIV
jgi:hypothetical protein